MTQPETGSVSVQDSALSSNPLLADTFWIPFDRIRPEHVQPATEHLIAQARAGLDDLARAPQEGFAGFLDRLDTLTVTLQQVHTIVSHLDGVVSDDAWRAAKNAMLPAVSAFFTDLGMHAGLHAALKAYAQTPEAQTLDPVRARYLNLSLDEFRRSGADLPQEGQERLRALNVELSEVTSRYGSNSMDGITAYSLHVPVERLAGLPDRVKQATLVTEGEHAGQHRLTLHAPTFMPVMMYADDRALREELFRAFNAAGVGEGRDNRALLPLILNLRHEKAALLGYATFADFVLEDRMAKTGERAVRFEQDLTDRTRPAFERENAELEAFYREQAGPDAPPLAAWDLAYWTEKQRAALYDLDDEELRPYFEVNRVLDGLFEVARRLFGVKVTPASAPVWHPDVRTYDMHDEQGTHVASFYADWFPREGKRGGAWMNPLKVGGPDGDGFRPHLGLMCGNMTPPSGDLPALLSHDEVETVFHEFGHLLHHSLSRVPVRELSGTSVAWDFVELPSHIMENWTWNRETLALFARHYRTDAPLPDDLYDRMLRARNFRAANFAMRQYSFGTVDLALHTGRIPVDDTLMERAREVSATFMPVAPLSDDARLANFGHLFASPVGYAAGYYSYKWAETLDADAFTRFEQEGVLNRDTGRAFVDAVLSRGNSAPPETLFGEFMGREPDPSALLRRSGLA